ncbi:hypothetical protein K435DRAFT_886721 [Dendrothele bispora CBS 962.96]|uniref:ATPase AAA-type core domain-containing protein n=1 Tax=Dendrothele bispora (strain CBS 962.96) TaxID=1314807 RepID=A0A4S8M6R6_DENBC|nr:hypothetical protein K435DRAFT_886721 [Dendrothele bispora CBS 962.96]
MTPTDNDYLLFPAKVHGYSLSDQDWLEFCLDDITEGTWNPSIFNSFELGANNKYTICALIESQCNERARFDVFVPGKGRGLIFNLRGPPGVGKTFTAEATSEVTRSPLDMIGVGDLGTHAGDLDQGVHPCLPLESCHTHQRSGCLPRKV